MWLGDMRLMPRAFQRLGWQPRVQVLVLLSVPGARGLRQDGGRRRDGCHGLGQHAAAQRSLLLRSVRHVMQPEATPLILMLMGLMMPELGATRDNIHEMVMTELNAYLSTVTDEGKRVAALDLRAALERWASSELTQEITETAQALLAAEGHGDAPRKARTGAAWVQVI